VLWNLSVVYSKSVAIIMPEKNILPFTFLSHSSFSQSVFYFSSTGKGDIYKLCLSSVSKSD